MVDPSTVPTEELERTRDLGAVTYCRSYILLMARALGVDMTDTKAANAMTLAMVEPMNHATETIWRALMDDQKGKKEALKRFHQSLDVI